tara:strand:- start:4525 stop:5295 length:771 start_codon:yes stop_codon:yes gene_type:complete
MNDSGFIGKKNSTVTWNKVDEELIEYNSRQYQEMYRSTSFVIENLNKKIQNSERLDILDIGCGGGANLFHIAKYFKNCHFTGIDINEYFIEFARKKYLKNNIKNIDLLVRDIFSNFEINGQAKKYDVVGSSQVVSFLDFDRADQIFHKYFQLSKKSVYFQSLFTDCLLDYEINIYDHTYKKIVPYNIYSVATVCNIAKKYDFTLSLQNKFLIDIDLKNNALKRGTRTITKNNKERMMFSGDMYLPWQFLYFEKGKK